MKQEIENLKLNDLVYSNWFVDHPLLVCREQPNRKELCLIPVTYYLTYSHAECVKKASFADISVLERSKWFKVGEVNEELFTIHNKRG